MSCSICRWQLAQLAAQAGRLRRSIMPSSTDFSCDQFFSLGVAWGMSHCSPGPWQTSQETPLERAHFTLGMTRAGSTALEWQEMQRGLSVTLAIFMAVPMAFEGPL